MAVSNYVSKDKTSLALNFHDFHPDLDKKFGLAEEKEN